MILVDTSVWIEVFRKGQDFDIARFVPFDDIVTCLPVIQEVLQGFRDETAYRCARAAMFALPIVEAPLGREVFAEAVELYRSGRRAGFTVRSSVDCLIAACAIRNNLEVLHLDRDYCALSRISSLRERQVTVP